MHFVNSQLVSQLGFFTSFRLFTVFLYLFSVAIMDKIEIPIYRGLIENDSWYYGLLLLTQYDIPKVSAIMRVDCSAKYIDTLIM